MSDCAPITFRDGGSGTFTADSSAANEDVKAHFNMPEATARILASVTWDRPEWSMGFDVGIGTCPHNGETFAEENGDGGLLELALLATDAEGTEYFEEDVRWFLHLELDMSDRPDDGETTQCVFYAEACSTAG